MICPHCRKSLKQRERPNQTCSQCHRPFALDPKTNALKAHDLMVTRVADKLSDGGKLRYTGVQLWYALSRKALKDRPTGIGCGLGGAIVVLVIAGFCALDGFNDGNYALVAAGVAVWLAVIIVGVFVIASRRARIPTIEMPLRWPEFTSGILGSWFKVYRSDPPGLAKAADYPKVSDPAFAVLCPDRSVLFCLEANGIPERLGAALASRIDQVPVGVPVLVLHDASPDGCALVAQVRAELPGRRVMDGGLRPRAVMGTKNAVRLRVRPVRNHVDGVDAQEQQWLAKGWWSPIGAVRPAALIRRVEEAARRTDPAHRAAQEVGFLTWPAG